MMHHPGRNHFMSNPDIIHEEVVDEYPMPDGFFSDRNIDKNDK